MARADLINLAYLVAAILFITGLKGLTHPRTAVRGNALGAVGMLIAVLAVLIDQHIVSYWGIAAGLAVGAAIGGLLAVRIQMTSMPQLVALFNGFGGAASAAVAASEFAYWQPHFADHLAAGGSVDSFMATNSTAIAVTALIGSLTFTGSVVAFAKLQELISDRAAVIPGAKVVNAVLLAAGIGLSIWMVFAPSMAVFWALVAVAAIFGVTLVLPIGGADMPVVIALLNSYSGLAAAAAGFILRNNALIIGGSLVGASGLILTAIMCKAMNRSLANVLFGGVGAAPAAKSDGQDIYAGKVKATSAEEVAMLLESASRVVFVPGYGMAVAQAQHAVRDLMNLLEERGIEVEFGIHPVAGRMPGHMNVLLAESDVPYDKLLEMDQINPTMQTADVAIVLGANDVVNPVARTDPKSPIAGMPIIDVDKARTVVVIKRSLSPGFAGIPNPLFAADNSLMLFGDGKQAVMEMSAALKEAA